MNGMILLYCLLSGLLSYITFFLDFYQRFALLNLSEDVPYPEIKNFQTCSARCSGFNNTCACFPELLKKRN
jgi:hypothetical protein